MILTVLIAIILFCLSFYYYKYHIKPKNLIKWYKTTLEIMGYNVLVFPYQPHKIMLIQNQKYNQKEYNDAFYDEKYNWKNYDIVITNTSYMITLIFIKPRLLKHLFAPEKIYIIQKSSLNKFGFKLALGNTLILNQGDIWKKKRKLLSQIFNFDFIKRNIPKMKQICNEMLDKMESNKMIKESNDSIYYKAELKPIFGDIISNIIVRCFVGGEGTTAMIDGVSINKYLSDILKDARDQSTDYLVLLLGQRAYHWGIKKKYRDLMSKIGRVKNEVKDIISKRMNELSKTNGSIDKYTDILEAMWILKTNGQKQLSPLDQNQIIQQFCAFMVAGNDSTSLFTNMILYYLCENPEVQSKLREEVETHIIDSEDINFANIKKLKYLQWIQLETTRMYGPATSIFLREAVKDTTIDNIPVFKGVGIKMELLPNHYNQKYFKDPLKFKPERWNISEQPDPYSFGGFSFGARTCLGKHLAYLSAKVIVVMLLKRYAKIEIQKSSEIRFQFKGFYTPSRFQSILVKRKVKAEL